MKYKPLFITFEGCDGAGKSTQITRIGDILKLNNIDYMVTREPGGVETAEEIRNFILHNPKDDFLPMTEVMLHMAARAEHLQKKILPALKEGKSVICDRFIDSTIIYQGIIGGVPIEKIKDIYNIISGGIWPDLTFVIDIDIEISRQRANSNIARINNYEKRGADFHSKINLGFKKMTALFPNRCKMIDGNQDVNIVTTAIKEILSTNLDLSM
jgi:dTMP kinase